MNFSGMFFPYLLGNGATDDFKWNCQVSEAILSKQASWTGAHTKKKGTRSLTAERAPQGAGKLASNKIHWQIVIIWPPLMI